MGARAKGELAAVAAWTRAVDTALAKAAATAADLVRATEAPTEVAARVILAWQAQRKHSHPH